MTIIKCINPVSNIPFSIEFGYDADKKPYLTIEIPSVSGSKACQAGLQQLAEKTTQALFWILNDQKLKSHQNDKHLKVTYSVGLPGNAKKGIANLLRVLCYLLTEQDIGKHAVKDKACSKFIDFYNEIEKLKDSQLTKAKKSVLVDNLSAKLSSKEMDACNSVLTVYAKKTNTQSEYIVKKHVGLPGKIIEIESAIAALHRAYLGYDRAPKNRAVYDAKGKRFGLASKPMPGFVSFNHYLQNEYTIKIIKKTVDGFQKFKKSYNYTPLVECGIVEMLVSAYFFAENDLHDGNWGFDAQNRVVRIDFDQAFWPKLSKFVGHHPDADHSRLANKPSAAFPIEQTDIEYFPDMVNTTPYNWVFGGEGSASTLMKFIDDVSKHPDFQRRKWTAFLKAILMPVSLSTQIMGQYIGDPEAAAKYTEFFLKRQASLRSTLLKMKAFGDFLVTQGDEAIENILRDIHLNYNCKEKHNKYSLNEIVATYVEIKNSIKAANTKKTVSWQNDLVIAELKLFSAMLENNGPLKSKISDVYRILKHTSTAKIFEEEVASDQYSQIVTLTKLLTSFATAPSEKHFQQLMFDPLILKALDAIDIDLDDAKFQFIKLHRKLYNATTDHKILPDVSTLSDLHLIEVNEKLKSILALPEEDRKPYELSRLSILILANKNDEEPTLKPLHLKLLNMIDELDKYPSVTPDQKQKCLQDALSNNSDTVNGALFDAQRLLVRAKLAQLTDAKTALATCIDKLPAEAIHLHAAKTKILARYEAQHARIKKQLEKSQSLKQLENLLAVIGTVSERITADKNVIDALSVLHAATKLEAIKSVADIDQLSQQNHKKLHQQGRAMFKASDQLAADYLKKYDTPIEQLDKLKSTISLSKQLVSNPQVNTADNCKNLRNYANSLVRHTSRARTILDIITVIAGTASLIAATALAVTGIGLPIALGLYGVGGTLVFSGGISFFSERHRTAVNRTANGLADRALASKKREAI